MTKKKNGATYSSKQLIDRLMFTQDLFERLGGCPFYPLKDTALSIRGGQEAREMRGEIKEDMEGDAIYVGVRKKEWTRHRKSMLRTLEHFLHYKVVEDEDGITIRDDRGEQPTIHLKIITRNYKFFKNPDICFWGVTEFLMPNPFDDYWKVRHLIK